MPRLEHILVWNCILAIPGFLLDHRRLHVVGANLQFDFISTANVDVERNITYPHEITISCDLSAHIYAC
jgi:hypothetical protein